MSVPAPLRILIVEDEALLAMELEGLLGEAGHDVVGWATSATEAFALATSTRPDLAFVDLQLSDGDCGIALAGCIRAATESVVVFITANAGMLPADYGGAVGVISKPYSIEGIRGALRYLHEGLRMPPPRTARPASLSLSPRYRESWQVVGNG